MAICTGSGGSGKVSVHILVGVRRLCRHHLFMPLQAREQQSQEWKQRLEVSIYIMMIEEDAYRRIEMCSIYAAAIL